MTDKLIITGNAFGDFLVGAAVVLTPLIVKRIARLFLYPCLRKVQDKAKAPIPKLGDDSRLTVWGFSGHAEHSMYNQGIVDSSPFVARVEAYLKLLGKEYSKLRTAGLRENPRRMVPMANIYGTMVDDSSRILDQINKHFQTDPDSFLTPEQANMGFLIQRLLTDSLYFVVLYLNFATEPGRLMVKNFFPKDMPSAVAALVIPMVNRHQMERLQGQGIASLTEEQVCEKGKKDLEALAKILGTNEHILGTAKPTLYDTDVYAFVAPLFYSPATRKMGWVREVQDKHPFFAQYIDHMRSLLFPKDKQN